MPVYKIVRYLIPHLPAHHFALLAVLPPNDLTGKLMRKN